MYCGGLGTFGKDSRAISTKDTGCLTVNLYHGSLEGLMWDPLSLDLQEVMTPKAPCSCIVDPWP